jgi:hypothetical protein
VDGGQGKDSWNSIFTNLVIRAKLTPYRPPLVSAIPVLVDQFYNAGCAERLGVGVVLERNRLNEAQIVEALEAVLGVGPGQGDRASTIYQQRAKEVSRALASRPEDPEKTFAQHVEYAAEFPTLGPHLLQMESAGMPAWKYYCLDVAGIGIVSLMGAVLAAWALRRRWEADGVSGGCKID